MGEDKIFAAWEAWLRESTKYDYYVLGITGFICAYIARGFVVQPVRIAPNTLELFALFTLIGSFICGFIRVQQTVGLLRIGIEKEEAIQKLRVLREAQAMPAIVKDSTGTKVSAGELAVAHRVLPLLVDGCDDASNKTIDISSRAFTWRNILLVLGGIMMLASKVWYAYY